MFTNCAELRLEDKEESLAAYREYIELETKEKDPARIQANRKHSSGLCHMSSWLFGHHPPSSYSNQGCGSENSIHSL